MAVQKNNFGFHGNQKTQGHKDQLNNFYFKYQICQMKLGHLNTFLQFRLLFHEPHCKRKKKMSIKGQRSGRKRGEKKKKRKKNNKRRKWRERDKKTNDKNTERKEREGWAEMRLIMGKVRCDNDGGSD